MTATPVDPDHAAMWDAIKANGATLSELKEEIAVNGYGEILREIARRYKARREVLAYFRRPLSLATKLAWIVVGALIWGVANHVFGLWPTGTR